MQPDDYSIDDYSIYVHRLSHRYGERTVLKRIELRLLPGAFFGFLGQNGAGKSTLIRLLCGFTPPMKGEIRVAGVDMVRDPMAARQHIGVVSEDVALYDRLTGAEFLEFAGQMHGLSAAEARKRASDLLERLDLTDAAGRAIGSYSLGMQKKTAFAAALIHAPRVLFLDEPFNGVDAASTRTLCALLKHLTGERGVTVFFTSHVLEMAERLCDRIAILHEGEIQRQGTVAELKAEAVQQGAALEEVFLQRTGARIAEHVALEWFA
ncbi:MAG TPA: ABC transporter ATP-binding protein [Chthonomonadaceae bacterium]|nr:ABC transporter ATP-binding protein [Chthonomonadaceae bacterium]